MGSSGRKVWITITPGSARGSAPASRRTLPGSCAASSPAPGAEIDVAVRGAAVGEHERGRVADRIQAAGWAEDLIDRRRPVLLEVEAHRAARTRRIRVPGERDQHRGGDERERHGPRGTTTNERHERPDAQGRVGKQHIDVRVALEIVQREGDERQRRHGHHAHEGVCERAAQPAAPSPQHQRDRGAQQREPAVQQPAVEHVVLGVDHVVDEADPLAERLVALHAAQREDECRVDESLSAPASQK